ncbi:MAG TPA: riboflavin synthase [Flavipsychrobacter sp.]|nr:riboflavin synthase [Flavipsychrobacter sp.]
MFTGIIETLGTIAEVIKSDGVIDLWVQASITSELKVDQSVAHNGICLTVVAIRDGQYRVTAVAETIRKTNIGQWKVGDKVNLERALRLGDRLDGHFVQGHVDTVGQCINIIEESGNRLYTFQFPEEFGALVIEKGSVCIHGVSLTSFNVTKDTLTVAIIPYTYEHTTFQYFPKNQTVNLEWDILGKYFLRKEQLATL